MRALDGAADTGGLVTIAIGAGLLATSDLADHFSNQSPKGVAGMVLEHGLICRDDWMFVPPGKWPYLYNATDANMAILILPCVVPAWLKLVDADSRSNMRREYGAFESAAKDNVETIVTSKMKGIALAVIP